MESDPNYVPSSVEYDQDVISLKIFPLLVVCISAYSCEHPCYWICQSRYFLHRVNTLLVSRILCCRLRFCDNCLHAAVNLTSFNRINGEEIVSSNHDNYIFLLNQVTITRDSTFTRVNGNVSCLCNKCLQKWPTVI